MSLHASALAFAHILQSILRIHQFSKNRYMFTMNPDWITEFKNILREPACFPRDKGCTRPPGMVVGRVAILSSRLTRSTLNCPDLDLRGTMVEGKKEVYGRECFREVKVCSFF